jgi:Periplasmic lysozyme inhibitor of I-type lysozyme
MRIWVTAMVLLLAASVQAAAQDRFVSKLTLPTGKTVVVAEGDFEARSIGSFSVRLYEAAAAPDEATFFISGLVRARDGVVEKVMLADINGDQQQEIVVTVRSVGTGSYLSAHAFAVAKDKLVFLAEVEGLAANADPVAALREARKK